MVRIVKKTRLLCLRKTIRSNRVSFFALLVFACLSVAFYIGIGGGGLSLHESVYRYAAAQRFHDFAVVSPLGFSEEDVAALEALEGVDAAEGVYIAEQFFERGGERFLARILSVTDRLDRLSVVEGRLPKAPEEAAVEGKWAQEHGVRVGERISLCGEGGLANAELVIVALVESPAYFGTNTILFESTSGDDLPLDTLLFAAEDAFDRVRFPGYPQVLLSCGALRDYADGSEEYRTAAAERKRALEPSVEEIVSERYGRLAGLPLAQSIGETSYALLTRDDSPSVSVLQTITDMFAKFKVNVSLPFLVICMLICFSVILRLTDDEARQIGIQLALGTEGREVMAVYLAFSAVPGLLGSVLGALLGSFVIEPLFLHTISEVWAFETPVTVLQPMQSLALIAGTAASMTAVAALSCRFVLRRDVLSLLNRTKEKALAPAFYEKSGAWRRLPLLSKCIVNNLRTDSLRITVTLIGLIGCTTLTVSAFYFIDSVRGAFSLQFRAVQEHELIVFFDPESGSAEEDIVRLLDGRGVRTSPLYTGSVRLRAPDGKTIPASVLVSDSDFDGLLRFTDRVGAARSADEGLLVSCPYALYYAVKAGDALRFSDSARNEYAASVVGVFNFYLTRQQLVFSKEAYEDVTGKECRFNAVLVGEKGLSRTELDALLRGVDGYRCTYDYKTAMYKTFSIYERIALAVCVLELLLSLSMALFMLLNLFFQYVHEKKPELIILLINGYSVRQAQRYLSADTVFLTALGLLTGAALGNLLGIVNVRAMLSAFSYFPHGVDWRASVIGMAISAAFTAVICARALAQVRRFEISDID